MEKWRNCVAIVTGANSGIGYSILSELSNDGLKVVGLDINIDALTKLKADSGNKDIYPIICDITQGEPTEKAFKWVDDNLGRCDILINNAGMIRNNGILDFAKSMQETELNINLNFTAVVRCSRLAFKSMTKHDSFGYIININSVCGHSVVPALQNSSFGVYNGTKYAITASAEVMRHELNMMKNRKVRITNISPGVVQTDIFKESNFSGHTVDDFYKGPTLSPKNISDTVIYLLTTPLEVNVADIILRATGAEL